MKSMLARRIVVWLATALCPGVVFAQQVFGGKDYTVSKVAGVAFVPADSSYTFHTSGSIARYGAVNTAQHFYASMDLPAGAKIDYISLSNLNDGTAGVITATLWYRINDHTLLVGSVSNTPHTSWQTDKNPDPLGFSIGSLADALYILDVGIESSPNNQFFAWAGVSWKRQVRESNETTFSDVPIDHPFHKYVEALAAAGITGGYTDGRFGVDDPVTRGQMAVFLSIALGLHWPY